LGIDAGAIAELSAEQFFYGWTWLWKRINLDRFNYQIYLRNRENVLMDEHLANWISAGREIQTSARVLQVD